MKINILFMILILSLSGCANRVKKAGRDMKYSALEMVGLEKRDLFKSEVRNVKDAQEETGEEFEDALEALKNVYAFDGGSLERDYDRLKSAYDDSLAASKEVKERITKLETVAGDLFVEWREELTSIKTASLRAKSAEKLRATETRFNGLKRQLHSTSKKMDPILAKFNDQVLFIKHNLNAEAIGSLKAEGDKIKVDVNQLLAEMKKSIAEADKIIDSL